MGRTKQISELEPGLTAAKLRVGLVLSRFNESIGDGLLSACEEELLRLGVAAENIRLVTVPGALEIPLALQTMALTEKFDALVALGCVVRGETYHFEIVSNESARGITDVQLATGVPVANAVLTTENDDQALIRMAVKGREAAQAAVEMANLQKEIRRWQK